jgi:antitoxin CcdA
MGSPDELETRRRESLRRDAEALHEQVSNGINTETIVDAIRETRRDC